MILVTPLSGLSNLSFKVTVSCKLSPNLTLVFGVTASVTSLTTPRAPAVPPPFGAAKAVSGFATCSGLGVDAWLLAVTITGCEPLSWPGNFPV